jgi:hypothetical protein
LPLNTPIDFLSNALQRAEQSFGWKFMSSPKQFRMPEVGFGDGLAKVVGVQERHTEKVLGQLGQDAYVTLVDRTNQNVGELIAAKAAIHTEPFVVVIANFFSVEIIECTPRAIGAFIRWDYKVSKLIYEDKQQFVNHIASKKYLPFVSEHVPENLLFNTIMNYTYWRPVTTSSHLVKDIWRAFLTSSLSEIGAHTSVHNHQGGIVYLTGEIPVFLQDEALLQLALVDGLGLSGMWKVVVDDHYQFLPQLFDNKVKNPFSGFSGSTSALWIIPQSNASSPSTEIELNRSVCQAIHGNLYTYGSHAKVHDLSVRENNKSSVVKVPDWLDVKRVIIDKRPWPVTYGPNTMANSVKIPQWISRIRNIIKTS